MLDVLDVDVEITRDQDPVLEVLRADQFGDRREVLWVLDVLLGEGHPAIGPFGHRVCEGFLVRARPRDVDLEELRHPNRVLAGLTRTVLELAPQHADLLIGRPDRDHPVGQPAGLLRVDGPSRGDIDLDRLRRARVELCTLELEMVAAVFGDRPREQLVDDLDSLEQHRAADADLRPFAAHDVLIERLARAQAQPEPTGKHGPEGRRRMRDDRRVVAEAGTGHGRSEGQARAHPERAHERPGEGALALLWRPRMEMLADHEPGREPGVLRRRAVVEELGRVELLEHGGVADLRHRVGLQSRAWQVPGA